MYWKTEERKSEMGAYNIPFYNGKIISQKNTQQDQLKFTIILCIICVVVACFKI